MMHPMEAMAVLEDEFASADPDSDLAAAIRTLSAMVRARVVSKSAAESVGEQLIESLGQMARGEGAVRVEEPSELVSASGAAPNAEEVARAMEISTPSLAARDVLWLEVSRLQDAEDKLRALVAHKETRYSNGTVEGTSIPSSALRAAFGWELLPFPLED